MVRIRIGMRKKTILMALLLAGCAADVHRGPSAIPARTATHVVIVGDSVARGLGAHLAGVVNLGIDGARTTTVHSRLHGMRAALREADAIVISIGGNDLYGDNAARLVSTLAPGLAMRIVTNRVVRLVDEIREENADARIYLLGLYNPYRTSNLGAWVDEQVAHWDSRLIERFAETPAVTVVRIADLFESSERFSATDHFHPSASGYAAIATRISIAPADTPSR